MLISILILADSLFGNLTLERSKAQEDPLKLRIASLLFLQAPSPTPRCPQALHRSSAAPVLFLGGSRGPSRRSRSS
jgi:hypothetical protein